MPSRQLASQIMHRNLHIPFHHCPRDPVVFMGKKIKKFASTARVTSSVECKNGEDEERIQYIVKERVAQQTGRGGGIIDSYRFSIILVCTTLVLLNRALPCTSIIRLVGYNREKQYVQMNHGSYVVSYINNTAYILQPTFLKEMMVTLPLAFIKGKINRGNTCSYADPSWAAKACRSLLNHGHFCCLLRFPLPLLQIFLPFSCKLYIRQYDLPNDKAHPSGPLSSTTLLSCRLYALSVRASMQ